MFWYEAFRETIKSTEVGEHIAYGIIVCCDDGGKNRQVHYIHDVFISEREANEFTEKCNRLVLSPIHIDDVIQDAIG